MTTTVKTVTLATVRRITAPHSGPYHTPAWTTEERLQRIDSMGLRISSFVEFMCKAGNHNGISAEAKEKAIAAFYEQMVIAERQLERIQHDLKLV